MATFDKPLIWLKGEVRTPPFSHEARLEAGYLLRQLQQGVKLGLPRSRPLPSIGSRCHELRVVDSDSSWRIIYRIDLDAIIILEVFSKRTQKIPKTVADNCKNRIKRYDELS